MPVFFLVFEFLGTTELVVIAAVALLIFGPRKLPEIGRTIGRSLAEFKRASEDFKRTWEYEVEMERSSERESSAAQGQVNTDADAPRAALPPSTDTPDADDANDATAAEAVEAPRAEAGERMAGSGVGLAPPSAEEFTVARGSAGWAVPPADVEEDAAAERAGGPSAPAGKKDWL